MTPREPSPVHNTVVEGKPDRELLLAIAVGALRGGLELMSRPAPRPKPDPARDLMTLDQVAAFLGLDRSTVREYVVRGVIPHQRIGTRVLFRRRMLVAWLQASIRTVE